MKACYFVTMAETIRNGNLDILYGIQPDDEGIKELLELVSDTLHDLATAATFSGEPAGVAQAFTLAMTIINRQLVDKR